MDFVVGVVGGVVLSSIIQSSQVGGTSNKPQKINRLRRQLNRRLEYVRPYLENVEIQYADDTPFTKDYKKWLIQRSLGDSHVNFVNDFNTRFGQLLGTFAGKTGWQKCSKQCYQLVSQYIQQEINSTAYVLRALGASLLSSTAEGRPKFVIKANEIKHLTGVWSNDMRYFTMKTFLENNATGKGTLILGFGPSASGKTYWAKNIIKMIQKLNGNFPSVFLSIDGGIYREQSIIYQAVVNNIIHKSSMDGLRNLVTSNFFRKKITDGILFDSNIIKTQIKKFLNLRHNPRPNLYVPETLGGCTIKENNPLACRKKVQKFIRITNSPEDWIGLCIWQHMLPISKTCRRGDRYCCPYEKKYRCESTTAKGVDREKTEGKKYSNSQWERSFVNGITESMKAPNDNWYHIHNTGGYGCKENNCATSIIEIHPSKAKELLQTKEKQNQLKDIEEKYNCEFRISDKMSDVKRFDRVNDNGPILKSV